MLLRVPIGSVVQGCYACCVFLNLASAGNSIQDGSTRCKAVYRRLTALHALTLLSCSNTPLFAHVAGMHSRRRFT